MDLHHLGWGLGGGGGIVTTNKQIVHWINKKRSSEYVYNINKKTKHHQATALVVGYFSGWHIVFLLVKVCLYS